MGRLAIFPLFRPDLLFSQCLAIADVLLVDALLIDLLLVANARIDVGIEDINQNADDHHNSGKENH